jgi:spore germination protein GerM
MMSRERELLKQVVENFAYVQDMHLIVAIQKLLNQPEQEPTNFDLKPELSDEQKRLEAIAIKQREAHGIGGGE